MIHVFISIRLIRHIDMEYIKDSIEQNMGKDLIKTLCSLMSESLFLWFKISEWFTHCQNISLGGVIYTLSESLFVWFTARISCVVYTVQISFWAEFCQNLCAVCCLIFRISCSLLPESLFVVYTLFGSLWAVYCQNLSLQLTFRISV